MSSCERPRGLESAPISGCRRRPDGSRIKAGFMPGWEDEPTIKSMLNVLDHMHEKLAQMDHASTLARLTDRQKPAIAFHVLDLSDMGLDEDIYIHMNSRGKPLTDFEIFKARFVQATCRISVRRGGKNSKRRLMACGSIRSGRSCRVTKALAQNPPQVDARDPALRRLHCRFR